MNCGQFRPMSRPERFIRFIRFQSELFRKPIPSSSKTPVAMLTGTGKTRPLIPQPATGAMELATATEESGPSPACCSHAQPLSNTMMVLAQPNAATCSTKAPRLFATLPQHIVTGTQKCTDGKPWGATENFGPGSWQSGMWTGTLAFGTWLIWDKLDPALQQPFQRVVAWECDILSHRPPPNGLWLDTKAEENGWEVPCLVLGELMFPSHPHAPPGMKRH